LRAMLDIQRTSSLIWRFETARLEDITILGSSCLFSMGDLIYTNVKLLRISQEKIFHGRIQRWPGRCRRASVLENSRKGML